MSHNDTKKYFEKQYIRYSWQGYKNGKKLPRMNGGYSIEGFMSFNGWDFMMDDIKKKLRSGKKIDTVTIKREVIPR